MPQNYKKDIDWIIDAYELAQVAFSDGFQKDAIQNASGARATDKWDGWKCKIDLVENEKGKFLVIEDEGTARGGNGPLRRQGYPPPDFQRYRDFTAKYGQNTYCKSYVGCGRYAPSTCSCGAFINSNVNQGRYYYSP